MLGFLPTRAYRDPRSHHFSFSPIRNLQLPLGQLLSRQRKCEIELGVTSVREVWPVIVQTRPPRLAVFSHTKALEQPTNILKSLQRRFPELSAPRRPKRDAPQEPLVVGKPPPSRSLVGPPWSLAVQLNRPYEGR